ANGRAEIMSRILLRPGMVPLPRANPDVGWTTRGPSLFRLADPPPDVATSARCRASPSTHDARHGHRRGYVRTAAGDPCVGDSRRDRVHGRADRLRPGRVTRAHAVAR